MDFSKTQRQQELYDTTLEFARTRFPGRRPEGAFRADLAACGEFGLLGLSVPEEHGGMGLDPLSATLAIEAFGRGCEDMGLAFSVAAHLLACAMPIAEHGSADLRARVLPGLCAGTLVGANAITEGEAGSDAYALSTRAVRDGDVYVLTGTKTFVTNGPAADVVIVFASTNPKARHLGLSAFVVECASPGVKVGRPFETMGLTTSPISSMYLEECRVPASGRLGPEGAGARVFQRAMGWERCCLFAAYVGMMDRQLERAVAYTRERRQFGRAIAKNQAVSHRIAGMKLRLEAARALVYRAAWTFGRGQDAAMDIALAKLAVSEAAVQSGLDAIQLFGGAGYVTSTGVEAMLRDAIPATIFSGTSEMQREIVAGRLGL